MGENEKRLGKKVRLSEEGRKAIRKRRNNHERIGTIMRLKDNGCFIIIWDDNNVRTSIHSSFVEIINP